MSQDDDHDGGSVLLDSYGNQIRDFDSTAKQPNKVAVLWQKMRGKKSVARPPRPPQPTRAEEMVTAAMHRSSGDAAQDARRVLRAMQSAQQRGSLDLTKQLVAPREDSVASEDGSLPGAHTRQCSAWNVIDVSSGLYQGKAGDVTGQSAAQRELAQLEEARWRLCGAGATEAAVAREAELRRVVAAENDSWAAEERQQQQQRQAAARSAREQEEQDQEEHQREAAAQSGGHQRASSGWNVVDESTGRYVGKAGDAEKQEMSGAVLLQERRAALAKVMAEEEEAAHAATAIRGVLWEVEFGDGALGMSFKQRSRAAAMGGAERWPAVWDHRLAKDGIDYATRFSTPAVAAKVRAQSQLASVAAAAHAELDQVAKAKAKGQQKSRRWSRRGSGVDDLRAQGLSPATAKSAPPPSVYVIDIFQRQPSAVHGDTPMLGDLLVGMRSVVRQTGHQGIVDPDTQRTTFFGGSASQGDLGSAIRNAERPLVLVFARIGGGQSPPQPGNRSTGGAGGHAGSGGQQEVSRGGASPGGGAGTGRPRKSTVSTDSLVHHADSEPAEESEQPHAQQLKKRTANSDSDSCPSCAIS